MFIYIFLRTLTVLILYIAFVARFKGAFLGQLRSAGSCSFDGQVATTVLGLLCAVLVLIASMQELQFQNFVKVIK